MRRPKKKATASPDQLSCLNCKRHFDAQNQYKRVSKRDGVCSRFGCLETPPDADRQECAGGCIWVICRDQPSCRARVLAVDLGIDLFTQYPRERLFYEMDIRPANYQKTKWKSIFTEDERVMAGWLYYSWCFPVCMAYAVQIDADDELMHDRWGQPMVMTQERLGQILGIPYQNIFRATKRLEARKKLRIDDGQVYPTPKPTITPDERQLISTDELSFIGPDRNSIPLRYRQTLNDYLGDLDPLIRTDYRDKAIAFCTDYNTAHKLIRTERDSGIEQVCIEIATLLSRQVTFKKRTATSPSPADTTAPQSSSPVIDGVETTPLKELYEAGMGKGAMAKLPSPRPSIVHEKAPSVGRSSADENTTDRPSASFENPFKPRIREWMESHIAIPGYALEERELDQIAATIHTEKHLEQFQEAALRQRRPRGWIVFVAIALKCEKLHEKYQQASGGGESYFERKAREEK